MKIGTRGGAALALALILAGGFAAQAAVSRAQIGDVSRVQKSAHAIFQNTARPLWTATPVLFEDLLRTGADARLKAQLVDGTELTLGEKAEMLIDEFVYEPDGTEAVLSLKLVRGALLFVSGKIEQIAGSRVKIKTPVGILGVRGTKVWMGRIDEGYGVLVLDGSVAVAAPNGEVTVNAGEGTMIYENKPPTQPKDWAKAKIDRAVTAVNFKD